MTLYKLKDYIKILEKHKLITELNIKDNDLEKEIINVCYNSKEVRENTLYICKGLKFKSEYLDEALLNNALCYICEKENNTRLDKAYIVVSDVRKALSLVSKVFYDYPSKNINMIGITGTKGKSTTAYYIKSILDSFRKSLGEKETAIISSIDVYDGKIYKEALMTSPESLELESHIRNAVDSNIKDFIMEVSSQALKYDRVYDILYKIGIYLNISEDHISDVEHKDFNDYFYSKLKLFKQAENICLNLDSDKIEEVLEEAKICNRVLTFSCKNKEADVYAYQIRKVGHNTIKFRVKTVNFDEEIELNMPGLFNVENALAAISSALILNIPFVNIYEGLKEAKASGRMEAHVTKDEKIVAIVDYAHNKLSFEKLYTSVLEEYPNKDIITVFGCPGGKAQNRRKDLGLLSGKYSKVTYLTAEDPGPENTIDICEEIAKYVKESNGSYKIIEDRGEAIKEAIKENPNCVILITGKGNETRQKYGNTYVACLTDTDYVFEAFKEYEESVIKVTI